MRRAGSCDVVIIGAGLFGCATGLFLVRRGLSVSILERGHVGAQSSGANFGSLRLQGRSARQYPLSLRAQQLWESFEEWVGEPCEYDRTGHVYFARDGEGRERLLKYAGIGRAAGLDVELVEGAALRDRYPFLTDEACIASYAPRSATANPRLATPALCRAFLRAGGTVHTGCEVHDISRRGGGFEVRTGNGVSLSASRLVNAAGAWAGGIAAQFDEPVPLFGAGPPQFVTEPLPHILRPVLQSIEGDLILRQIPRGNFIFAGYPRTRSNAEGTFTFVPPRKLEFGMQVMARAMPALASVEVIRNWSGVEGYLPDMLPVIAKSETTDGLFHAFGGSGGGFQIGPAVGESLAALVAGDDPECSLEDYRIGRFAEDAETSDKIASEFDA